MVDNDHNKKGVVELKVDDKNSSAIWSVKEAILMFFSFLLFGIPILAVAYYTIQEIGPAAYIVAYLLLGLPGIIPLLWLKFLKKLPFYVIGFKKCPARYYIYGIIFIFVFLVLWQTISRIVLNLPVENISPNIPMSNKLCVPVILISLGIAIPLVEEIYFRGVLFSALKGKFGVVSGLIVSSLIYAMLHFSRYSNNPYWPLSFICTFLLGIIFAWLYHSSRSLLPSITCHCLQNLTFLLNRFFR